MALHRQGDAPAARKELAAAVVSYDWRPHKVRDQDDWIYHCLRREAEGIVLPDLRRFLAGEHRPGDNDERLSYLGACQFADRPLAAAGLYADAFATDPRLAADFRAGRRAAAAVAAARAGCGRGADSVGLSAVGRAEWRARAREWLRADLAAWERALKADPAAREPLARALAFWRADPDLAGLREPAELEKLPADERGEWVAFWSEAERASERTAAKK
jgi:serine/threonine-protein kinase